MVTLNRIYTKTGDDGSTMLGDGSRAPKTDPRVRAYGTVDELNAILGLALQCPSPAKISAILRQLQNELFDLGSDLCTPLGPAEQEGRETRKNRVPAARTAQLERWIDELQEDLKPLQSFVLPGGSPSNAWLHLARTVARRAEIEVLELRKSSAINPSAIIYLNRLSDLFFVMARWVSREAGEVLWKPGADSSALSSARPPAPSPECP